jgi:hypothetical protein
MRKTQTQNHTRAALSAGRVGGGESQPVSRRIMRREVANERSALRREHKLRGGQPSGSRFFWTAAAAQERIRYWSDIGHALRYAQRIGAG